MKKIIFLLLLSMIYAKSCLSESTTGVINFTGAITEPACIADVSKTYSTLNCTRSGTTEVKRYTSKVINKTMPFNLGSYSVIDKEGRRDVLVIYK
ncbi:hypothetical protein H2241_21315 [Pantoea ananatis]|uniref:hypothetical protein n=1 Tax=Pantoea ananas TaxID=553 RepID=UPI001589D23D|nr:hypothetical protein [Pantoea ananatis]MBA4823479.1 hypothetical protein [Pantoea ananatis]QKV88018.1 hypothetical protein FOB88_13210 [Pantoea ananatis]